MGSPTIFSSSVESTKTELVGPTWLDDEVIFIEADSMKQLLPKIQEVTRIFVETSRRNGFDVNFAAGKTEALIRWAGKESVQLRRDQTNDDSSCTIPVFGLKLCASCHEHVGLHNAPTGFLGEEIARCSR